MLKELLHQLGFSEKEIAVYLVILENGKISANDVAYLTKINRTTVYSIAKELVKRRVITEDLGGPVRLLIAEPPEELEQLALQDERRLAEKRRLISSAIKEIGAMETHAHYAMPKIQFVSEIDLERHLYKQTPKWNESILKTDAIWWGFQDPKFVKHYGAWIDWYWTKGVPEGITLQLVTNQSDIEQQMAKKKYDRRKIKYWEGSKNFTATTWVNGDFIVMIVLDQGTHYLIEMHDPILANNLRELFKGIWKSIV